MRAFIFVLLLLGLNVSLSGQTVVIANDKLNVVYAGIPNPITIAVENYKAGQVVVSTDNGILAIKGNGKYDYTPLNAGKAIIKIELKTRAGKKEIGQFVYRVKAIPMPIATTDGGFHSIGGFRIPRIIKIITTDWDFDNHFEIIDFKLQIQHKESIISTAIIKGAGFPANIFDPMKAGDRIFITEIHCMCPDKKMQTLNPIVYTFN